jgi:plastocyanin
MRVGRLLGAIGVVIAFVASGCGVESSPHLEIVARDFAFSGAPQTIRGGPTTVTFRNMGKAHHEMAFAKIGGKPLKAFQNEFPAVLEGGPIPGWLTAVAVPLELEPGKSETKTFTMSPGRYLLMCALNDQAGPQDDEEGSDAPPHFNLGMTQRVTVEGESDEVSSADNGEVVAKDYTFETSGLKAGLNRIVFRNDGPKQFHFGDLSEFPAGVTEAQALDAFKKFLATPEGQPPPAGLPEPETVGFSGVYSPGLGGTWDITLKSGRTYLLACFIQDRDGGPPHAIGNNMLTTFTVS